MQLPRQCDGNGSGRKASGTRTEAVRMAATSTRMRSAGGSWTPHARSRSRSAAVGAVAVVLLRSAERTSACGAPSAAASAQPCVTRRRRMRLRLQKTRRRVPQCTTSVAPECVVRCWSNGASYDTRCPVGSASPQRATAGRSRRCRVELRRSEERHRCSDAGSPPPPAWRLFPRAPPRPRRRPGSLRMDASGAWDAANFWVEGVGSSTPGQATSGLVLTFPAIPARASAPTCHPQQPWLPARCARRASRSSSPSCSPSVARRCVARTPAWLAGLAAQLTRTIAQAQAPRASAAARGADSGAVASSARDSTVTPVRPLRASQRPRRLTPARRAEHFHQQLDGLHGRQHALRVGGRRLHQERRLL